MLSDRDYMSGRPRHSYRHPSGRETSIILPLIIANVVVFLFTMADAGRRGPGLIDVLALSSYGVRHYQLWRLGTYMFVHGGFSHILWNMWGLYLFGRLVESRIGPRRFLQLYFTSGIIGGVVWLLFNWNSPIPVVGASGGVFGVMMAAAMMFPNHMIMLLLPPIPMRLKTFVAVYAGIQVVMSISTAQHRGGGIAYIAHLGGLLGAFVYMRWLLGRPGPHRAARTGLREWWKKRRAAAKHRRFDNLDGDRPSPDDDEGDTPLSVEVDRILDKIGREGLSSLTPAEKRTLDRARERLRGGRPGGL
ncbi:MAG: rhomboid family intramembrane serine protease [Kiritimatiellaeota bacterium]|nr:rhomboid family intramembrane serine protease [Kiritimatiellota bacterium]